MKKQTLITFAFGLILSVNSFAASALYLSAQEKEYPLIDWIKPEGDSQYKIYVATTDGRRHSRTVNKEEISLATDNEVNGFKVGRRALVLYTAITGFDHCQISNVFENGKIATYCDLFIEGVLHRRSYLTPSENMVPEVSGPMEGISQKDKMILTKKVGVIEAGTKVDVRAFFKNGKILVVTHLNPVEKYFSDKQLEYNAGSVVVSPSDLQPLSEKAD